MEKSLSVQEAAVVLGVSPYTLRAWVRQRRITHNRPGRRVVFTARDVQAFMAATRVEAKEEGSR
jgi:excisionase family DNA binding protein